MNAVFFLQPPLCLPLFVNMADPNLPEIHEQEKEPFFFDPSSFFKFTWKHRKLNLCLYSLPNSFLINIRIHYTLARNKYSTDS